MRGTGVAEGNMRCALLTSRIVLCCARYKHYVLCYGMCGTDIADGTMGRALSPSSAPFLLGGKSRYCPSTSNAAKSIQVTFSFTLFARVVPERLFWCINMCPESVGTTACASSGQGCNGAGSTLRSPYAISGTGRVASCAVPTRTLPLDCGINSFPLQSPYTLYCRLCVSAFDFAADVGAQVVMIENELRELQELGPSQDGAGVLRLPFMDAVLLFMGAVALFMGAVMLLFMDAVMLLFMGAVMLLFMGA
eukprot:727219-Rhodomonas_salina.1